MSPTAPKSRSHFAERGLETFQVFLQDGRIDQAELRYLIALAREEETLAPQDRLLLEMIVSRINRNMVSDEVWNQLLDAKRHFGMK